MEDREIKELEKSLERIWEVARGFGLDPYPVRFEVVPATVMYEIGSYALPGRYSHWTFGKAYHRMKTMYDFGLSKIYEVVINTNPSYGFLLETNSPVQNKLVMAHVLGHVDFFKNSAYFSRTNRRMVETVSAHAGRMSEYEFRHGRKSVERLLDAVLSIEEHIDPNFFIRRDAAEEPAGGRGKKPAPKVGRYDDLWNIGRAPEEQPSGEEEAPRGDRLPEKDLVYYIMRNSPSLKDWQRDVMAMVHEEMEYFVPQMQTKTLNEGWACLVSDALLPTEDGFIFFDELYERGERIEVASGGKRAANRITDFHKEERVPTLRVRTRRGLTIEGALKHRVLLSDGTWATLDEVKVGDKIQVEAGSDVWARDYQPLNYVPLQPTATMRDVAWAAGMSQWSVVNYFAGHKSRSAAAIESALALTAYERPEQRPRPRVLNTRARLHLPEVLNEEMAEVLGYFVGDGHRTKSGIAFTCGDEDYVSSLTKRIEAAFGLRARVAWDATPVGGRWRVYAHSRELPRLLTSLGIDLRAKAPDKRIPRSILRSPKSVVSAFLRGYFDADAYAGKEGIRLSSSSKELIRTVQIILLNYGILSTRRPQTDGCVQLEIAGASAARFMTEIGFRLERKQSALRGHVENRRWFRREEYADAVVSVERGEADVYDITVEEKHAYVANGFVNHNSFWHSRIMRELDLPDVELLEFAELHSGVVSPHKGQLNPYYLGYKILEDIERRWDSPTAEERERFGRAGGEGRAKIFEVRELESDVSFLRNYLTEELCEELDLFVYELVDEEEWTVTEKRWERVRDRLVSNMTNFGFPYIVVADGDYNGNRELYLKHLYESSELDLDYARRVLEHVHALWGRPVHLETIVDDEPARLHYNGEEHEED
jgi:stage V sporulation protein R